MNRINPLMTERSLMTEISIILSAKQSVSLIHAYTDGGQNNTDTREIMKNIYLLGFRQPLIEDQINCNVGQINKGHGKHLKYIKPLLLQNCP